MANSREPPRRQEAAPGRTLDLGQNPKFRNRPRARARFSGLLHLEKSPIFPQQSSIRWRNCVEVRSEPRKGHPDWLRATLSTGSRRGAIRALSTEFKLT